MNKKIKNISIFIIILSFFISFGFVNYYNFPQIKNQKNEIIKHPELLPKKEFIKLTAFGFKNLKADYYWIESIQYIGGNVLSSDYKKYLFNMLDLITELNPYFIKPYTIGQLLLPNYNERYENLDEDELLTYSTQGQNIGLKGIKNTCNLEKINFIDNEQNLEILWNEENYKNPCLSYEIPFGQGFLEFFYMKNSKEAGKYYKIASMNEESLEGAKNMAAVMNSKSGDREKSIMSFLSLAKNNEKENKNCSIISKELEKLFILIFLQNYKIDENIIKNLENISKEIKKIENKEKINIGNGCFFNNQRAIREFYLHFFDEKNKIYFDKFEKNSKNVLDLQKKGIINYIPIDFQTDEESEMVYFFNEETNFYDSKFGTYE
ncbi:MAG: hypothetical protein NWP80_00390 [Candidatus Gracilibacteria bacterium]|nr:hypothetical protein [Candidatus Gracilibacteria bacterium]